MILHVCMNCTQSVIHLQEEEKVDEEEEREKEEWEEEDKRTIMMMMMQRVINLRRGGTCGVLWETEQARTHLTSVSLLATSRSPPQTARGISSTLSTRLGPIM